MTRVPHSADVSKPTVFATAKQKRVRVGSLNRSNSRLLAVCNDAAVSVDGKRIYFTESYVARGATMGGSAALKPVIMLGRTGRLWMYDSEDKTVGLVANGYAFTDGILMEGNGNEPEESVLLTDNPRFQLHRVHLAGARAGESEVLWRDLPGLADGMRRDSKGRIWLTIITNHGNQIPWVHAHPGVKPMLMKHPQLISFPSVTSLLLLSPDALDCSVVHGAFPDPSDLHRRSHSREVGPVRCELQRQDTGTSPDRQSGGLKPTRMRSACCRFRLP